MCFLRHKITNVRILLMYGISMNIPTEFDFYHYINIPNWIFQEAVQRGFVSYRRAFLIFLLLYDFEHHQHSPQGLQCIWRSIKDPFLSHAELVFTLIQVMPLEMIFRIHCHYATFVSGGSCVYTPYPRKLKHFCRVEVRKLLRSLHLLPHEISRLFIPESLKPYLCEY
ncbi:hypothetical protein HNY73_016953 [Argiope bruennichi]|uniref:SOCS box domain-containing protein n=2 Tax=Argiope bruennichi TaxID=94029 RepID=A0A8T0EQC8_ARGBR|nr:hypothetical protein HNY73_016953 [Argiope bruennichi]